MADYGDELRTPAIPDPAHASPQDILRTVKEWIEVRQGVRGDGLDRAVTMRDLLNAGLATPEALAGLRGGPAAPLVPPGTADPAVPPTPENLAAAGAINTIILTWDFARGYSRLSHFEIFRSLTDNIAEAVEIAQVFSSICADEVGPGAKFYYWVRAVSDAGTSPFNALSGVLGETAMNVQEVIDAVDAGIDASGLLEQLTTKVDSEGLVTGYGPASTPSTEGGPTTVTFAVLAHRFLIAGPASAGVTTASPFFVQTVPTTVNGVAVPKGVYMTDAYLMNGVITTAKIGLLQVDDARIANVSVAKLVAGKLAVGEYIESTNFLTGDTGFHINGDGNAELNNVTVRGTVYATAGRIGGNIIDATGVQSPTYSGVAGWRIDTNGAAVFNNALIRGTIHAAAGTFAGSLSAATGTFAGSLSAATGTFTGRVQSGYLTTGAYTGYAWPAAGNYGSYLGPGGLLLGNANNGRYVQITETGDIYTPGFSVVAGTMTVNQANVINTLNIAGEAVTVPRGAMATNGVGLLSFDTTILSLPWIDVGASSVILAFSANFSFGQTFDGISDAILSLYRNGALIAQFPLAGYAQNSYLSGQVVDTPGGAAAYALTARMSGSQNPVSVAHRSLTAIGCKR